MLSCIIPIYNVEQYLRDCIESVLSQTYTDYELLLINDGSEDSSGEICKKYAESDNRIKYYCKENGGAASARNLGLEKAAGDFIVFCDSDDTMEPDYFETLIRIQRQTNADLVVVSVEKGYASGGKLLPDEIFPAKVYIPKAITSFEYIAVYSLCNKLIRRDVLVQAHLKMPEQFRLSEDRIFNLELLEVVDTIATSSYCGYHYRENPQSLTHNRLSVPVLKNIIVAELSVCRLTENVMRFATDNQSCLLWVEQNKRNAMFAMDAYIVKSRASLCERRKLRSYLFSFLTADSAALKCGFPLKSLSFILKTRSILLLSLWLWIMRIKQKVKTHYGKENIK